MADIYGTSNDDELTGTFRDDNIYGLAGNDVINSGGGFDNLFGGVGNDTYFVRSVENIYEAAGEGYDVVYAQPYSGSGFPFASLRNGQHVEELRVMDPDSTGIVNLYGNELSQIIVANNGASEIFGNGGADTLIGLGGADYYYVTDARTVVIEAANGGNDIVILRGAIDYRLGAGQHIEVLDGRATSGATNLTGNELKQVIYGNSSSNVIVGDGGPDTLIGGGGDDSYYVSDSRAVVWESANQGHDIVYATVNFTLGESEHVEKLLADDAAATTYLDLRGNNFAQIIAGNAGANLLVGRGGADILIGRAGDDSYGISDASARVWESAGEGRDVIYTTVSYALERAQEIEVLLADGPAGTAGLSLVGNELAQVIAGNAGANFIRGGGGADTLIGRGGDDSYFVSDASTLVWEDAGEGRDIVYTTVSYALEAAREIELLVIDDAASGNALNLTGNEFAQVIAGNAGANVLNGGAGADTLVGRGGADSFAFTTTLGNGNVDWIFDHEVGVDRILLDDAVFAGLAAGPLSANAFVIGAAAADADDRIIYNSGTGALFFDADGSGAGAAVQFATIGAGLALTPSEFTVI